MTREEATKKLKNLHSLYCNEPYYGKELAIALTMAIEALQKRPMTDLEKMKKAVTFSGYSYAIYEHKKYIVLEIVGFNNGRRLACFEFNNDGSFILEELDKVGE